MEKLNVICVYYNFCKYKRRKQLTLEYIERMSQYENINLYVCELVLEGEEFEITDKTNSKHLQLTTKYVLWYKENLINITVNKLLEKNWSSFAWIDSDIEFENKNWVNYTLEKIKTNDILQLFSFVNQYDCECNITQKNVGIIKKFKCKKDIEFKTYGHPGYAWAINRNLFEKLCKLPEFFIVGGCDSKIANAIVENDYYLKTISNEKMNINFYMYIINISIKLKKCKYDYIDTEIYHYYHGEKINRQYKLRYEIIKDYNPYTDIVFNENGLIEPNLNNLNSTILDNIKKYFYGRKEDN